jgi:hypothetical protein
MWWKRKPRIPTPPTEGDEKLIALGGETNRRLDQLLRRADKFDGDSRAATNRNLRWAGVAAAVAVFAAVIAARTLYVAHRAVSAAKEIGDTANQLERTLQSPLPAVEASSLKEPLVGNRQLEVSVRVCNAGASAALYTNAYAWVTIEDAPRAPDNDGFVPQNKALMPGRCMPAPVTRPFTPEPLEDQAINGGYGGELRVEVHLDYQRVDDPGYYYQEVRKLHYERVGRKWIDLPQLKKVERKPLIAP